jgi:hypothetical protein
MSVVTRVFSAHFDERPHEWRSVYDPRGYPELVTDVVTAPVVNSPRWVRGHRMIIVGEHPYDPADTVATPMLLVAVGTADGVTMGAAYYRQVDHTGIAGWVTVNPRPMPDAPALAFASEGWQNFPADAVVDVDQLRALVTEHLATGRRPECVPWRPSELVG